ncbi:MAG: hypothetical protein Dbin4_01805 [Alphaproteobacteria bacterium]|nr:hypothetical protein [Alphaproteobacteria bacterium]
MSDTRTSMKIANNRLITTERRYWTASVVSLMATIAILPYVPAWQAFGFFTAQFAANHLLSIIAWLFWKDENRDARSVFWENWLLFGNLTAGFIIGLTYALIVQVLPPHITSLVLMTSALLIGAWSVSNVPAVKCVLAFSLSSSLPILISLFEQRSFLDIISIAVLMFFVLSILKHARLVSDTYRASIDQVSGLQQQAQSAAQQGETLSQDYSRLRHLLDAVPVPVIVSNLASGLLVYLNQAALELIGIKDLSEKPGARGVDFFATPGERDKAVAKIMNNDIIPVEFQLKRADGSLFWAYYMASQMVYEGEPAIIGTITDVTARRQAEEELRQSEEKFRVLADHAHDMISIYSPDSTCLYVSPSVERLFGYRPDEFIGQPVSKFMHPEDIETIISINSRTIEKDEKHPVYLARMRHKNGHWEWVEASNTIERDQDTGKITQVSSVSRLVTERVRNEQELREARERAEAADRAKSDFLAHMSHEIRTPLNAVIGFSEVMRDQLFGPLGSPRYEEYINDIYESGTHLLALINDVLDMSKVESGKFELQEDRHSLQSIIDGAFRFLHDRAEGKLISLQSRLHDAPDLWCDKRVLTQVMLNLVGNAIKFTPERGRITVESQLNGDGCLELTVTDTGIGIAPEDLPTVLKAFGQARVSADTSSSEPGTGLGLSLSKSFVEKHGGSLSITSEVGIGTRVKLTLPGDRIIRGELQTGAVLAAI